MPYSNLSAAISANALATIKQKITDINNLLPFLINLTEEERQTLPKMGDKSLSFVNKALQYAEANASLVPPYINIVELKKDLKLTEDLTSILQPLSQLQEALDDTTMAAGSESYTAALAFYGSVKQASKLNIPGTQTIFNDLKTRFENSGVSGDGGGGSSTNINTPPSA
ncbi:MAG: hypothetical protein HYX39_05240 [Bacteroidetes bacterium]|nr:hypothetical protein [Bacteroidota bacterium]